MKSVVVETSKPKNFEPKSITLTFETIEELKFFVKLTGGGAQEASSLFAANEKAAAWQFIDGLIEHEDWLTWRKYVDNF